MWWIIAIMIFSVPIIRTITDHLRANANIKSKIIQDHLELEKMKHENYLLETEKLRLELEKMQLKNSNEDVYKI